MTGVTEPELTALLPPFEQAWAAYRRGRTIEGHPRTSRRDSTSNTGPFPTIADNRLFRLTSVTQQPIQAVQGQLLRLSHSNANQWIHLLHTVLNQA